MNHQQFSQSLERIHAAVVVLTNEDRNGRQANVMTEQLRLITHEASVVFGMMDEEPDDDLSPITLRDLHKESLGALNEARRKGGGRTAMIAFRLSRVYYCANDKLIELGQLI